MTEIEHTLITRRGSAIIPLDRKQKDGEITKEWYPLQPAGEVQVSLKWNTVLAKVLFPLILFILII